MLTTRHPSAGTLGAALAAPLAALLFTLPVTGTGGLSATPLSAQAPEADREASGGAGSGAPPNPGVTPRQRPPDLVILEERITHEGQRSLGVFGATQDLGDGEVWRVKVWRETTESVDVSTDMVGCGRSSPMRITEQGGRLVLRQLNPGGLITAVNRLDHLIWWAVCVPEQAGRDPAGLASLARQLGYEGNLAEREQLLPIRSLRPR